MGAGNLCLMGMILFQAIFVELIGYGLGIGAAVLFGRLTRDTSKLAFFMPWQVLFGTGTAIMLIATLSCLLSMRRVLVLEPAVVFQG